MSWLSGLFGSSNNDNNNFSISDSEKETYAESVDITSETTRAATSQLERSASNIREAECTRALSSIKLDMAESQLSGDQNKEDAAAERYNSLFETCQKYISS